jgi:IS5 family transposase
MVGEGRSRSDQFFRAVELAVDWSGIEEELGVIHNSRRGRPSHPPLLLFKTLLLQRWYDLSDPAVEDALNDRKSFARFVGLALDQSAPDHSVICRFRRELVARGLMDRLIARLMEQIEAKDLVVKQGTLMDATLIRSAARSPTGPRQRKAANSKAADSEAAAEPAAPAADPYISGKLSRIDPDARWVRKGGKATFGYKLHIAADDDRRIVRAHRVTAANVNDCLRGPDLVQPDGGAHYADKGYACQPLRDKLAKLGLEDGVMQLGTRHHPLRPAERRRNRILAKLRSKVEGVFGEMKRTFGLGRTRYLGLPKVQLECDLAVFAFNLKTTALALKTT